jgi:beta-xylosidase
MNADMIKNLLALTLINQMMKGLNLLLSSLMLTGILIVYSGCSKNGKTRDDRKYRFKSMENPFVTHMYTADPSARVFNDTLWVYPSHDEDTATWFTMVDWHVFSTTDMKNWTDHGVALALEDISWADKYAWAPDCEYKNGKYYFYFPTDQDYIGVAVGDRPYGPFKDALGKPLITRETPGVVANRDLIDPCIFIDNDGTPYLYFGQNHVNMVKLNEDMISFDDSISIIKGADHFFEAVWVHKYNNTYYLSYSGNGKILYATGDNPYGPFEYQGVILDEVNSGTNHHSIVQYKGQWYLFYHTSDLFFENNPEVEPVLNWDGINPFRRSICVDDLYYNDDGTIQKVEKTKEGVDPIH